MSNPGIGGLERVVELLTSGFARRRHDVHLALFCDPRAPRPPLAAIGDSQPVVVHCESFPSRDYLRERSALAALCRRLSPAVVHTHGYRADVLDAGVARRLGAPTVTTVHGFTGGDLRNRLYELLQLRAYRRFQAVVAVSHPLAALLTHQGIGPDRVHTIVNAWRPGTQFLVRDAARAALGVRREGIRVAFVGRLSYEKGADVLVEALGMSQAPPAVSFLGDGRERVTLEGRARDLRLEVRWHGAVPDAARYLRAFDAVILSSRTEGTPMVLFEAMEADVPIVATRVGGVPDVVSDAEAILVPPSDPRALATAITMATTHGDQARGRAAAAHDRLKLMFAEEPWLERYEELYDSLARPGSRHRA